MESESTTKVGSMIVALALLGMAVAGPAASAQPAKMVSAEDANEGGPCITVYTDPPGAAVSPENCKDPVGTNASTPP